MTFDLQQISGRFKILKKRIIYHQLLKYLQLQTIIKAKKDLMKYISKCISVSTAAFLCGCKKNESKQEIEAIGNTGLPTEWARSQQVTRRKRGGKLNFTPVPYPARLLHLADPRLIYYTILWRRSLISSSIRSQMTPGCMVRFWWISADGRTTTLLAFARAETHPGSSGGPGLIVSATLCHRVGREATGAYIHKILSRLSAKAIVCQKDRKASRLANSSSQN